MYIYEWIPLYCSACLVFIIKKGERERLFNRQAKQNIINALLNAMDKHRTVLVVGINKLRHIKNLILMYSEWVTKRNFLTRGFGFRCRFVLKGWVSLQAIAQV